MTIRFRILALLGILGAMAVAEGLLSVYLQQLIQQTRERVDQRAAVRDLQSRLEVALLDAKQHARDRVRGNGTPGALERAMTQARTHVTSLRDVTHDAEQRTRLDAVEQGIGAWEASWPAPDPLASRAAIETAIGSLEDAFVPLRANLTHLQIRQDRLYDDAQDAARRDFQRYATLMLAIPAVVLILLAVSIVTARRVLLDPLAAIADRAARISRGESPPLERSARQDEIGTLVNTFTDMVEGLRDREMELSGALALSRDLTARHREAEQVAQRAREELETVIETVPAALLLVHERDGVRLHNRAAARLIGAPPSGDAVAAYQSEHQVSFTLAGRDGLALPPERWPMMRALAGETIAGEEVVARMTDGRELAMLVSAAPLAGVDGRSAIIVLQDISALKAVDRLKDEFVSIVSHELRTPLTSIRGSLQLVLDDAGSLPDPDHRQLVQVALNNCERLIRIINDILDIAKIEAGKIALRTETAGVRDLVRTALDSVEGLARAAGVSFVLQIPDDVPPVEVDVDRVVQVLVNLLSNAVKFAPPRSRVTVEAAARDAMVEISVADRGRGIDEADQARLFQKFQQIDGSTTRATGGTGLGLAIVRGLVEQHGGAVSVASRPGEGTRFAFTLPVSTNTPTDSGSVVTRARAPGSARVLVVDDDDDFRLVTRRHLERAGFQVDEARDGDQAIARARADRPDVITVDLLMPGMNGWTLLRALRDDPVLADIPAVVVSAVADRAGNLARDVAVLAKASGIDVLLAELTSLLPVPGAGDILVAEDDDDLRALLVRTLRRRGFATREARNGADALAMLDDRVSLLVLDLNMPEVDGLDVLRLLRERQGARTVPVLVITGTEVSRESALAAGASGYLSKPLEVTEVARVVQRLVTRAGDGPDGRDR